MRRFIPWIRQAAILRPARANSASKLTTRKRSRSLRLEWLEGREMFTVAVTPVYDVTNAWTSGFQAAMRLESHEQANVNAWRLEFDLAANITSIWNAKIESRTGNHYVIVGPAWAPNLPAGGEISFGFVAGSSGTPATPANYLLNGETLGNTTPSAPALSIGDVTLNEGNSGTSGAAFTISLSRAATTPVTVRYATTNGTAIAGSDYNAVTNTITFAAGQTSKLVTIAVRGDTTVENDEAFYVDLAAASGATLAKARGTGTIKNDDTVTPPPPTPTGNFDFKVSSNWGSGYTAQLTMRNTATTPLNNWVLEFDYGGTITSIWDAKIASRTGNHYVIENAGYNSTIAAGGTMAFGFNGSPGGTVIAPTNFVLRTASGGGGGTTNQPPVAGADYASTAPGQAVVINLLANDSDPNGDALTVVSVTSAAHGLAALNADGSVRYTPAAGYTGTDTFNYQLRDAQGATATGTVTVNIANAPVPGVWPTQVYAPYIDMTLYPIYDVLATARTTGLRYFTLAFITADPSNRPAWGGFAAYGLGTDYDAALRTQLTGLRALGGDVIVSFGGAANREIAEVITNVTALQAAYQSIIDAYGLTHIDFDIEGAATADRASVDRRNLAIAGLQSAATAAGRALEVSYTLPVLPTGLTADGLYVLQSAVNRGVVLSTVNIMAMDYGDSAAPNPAGRMGDYAIMAATSLFNQLKTLYGTSKTDSQLWHLVGVTPMIGLNDVTTETFDQQEARELVAFAQQKGIGRLSMWSLNRDQQSRSGQLGYVDLKSSSVLQTPFEFSQIFNTITG